MSFGDVGDENIDSQMWTAYFHLGVAYLNQPALQIENLSLFKRDRLLGRYGDMRSHMGFQLLSLWSQLGDLKHQFIPGLYSFITVCQSTALLFPNQEGMQKRRKSRFPKLGKNPVFWKKITLKKKSSF